MRKGVFGLKWNVFVHAQLDSLREYESIILELNSGPGVRSSKDTYLFNIKISLKKLQEFVGITKKNEVLFFVISISSFLFCK